MKLNKVFFGFLILFASHLQGQVTLGNGENTLEISGSISTYYNHRDLDSGVVEKDKNRFNLRDAQIQIEGRNGKNWEYKIQFDIADVISGQNDPENPGLMDAWMSYKGLKAFDIRIGYGKIAWSRYNLTPFTRSAYWQRPEFLRGSFASVRDAGIELSKSFWKRRATIKLGVYTGLGEISIKGDNDASGALEYTGRFDLGWPTQFRFREIDDKHVRKPMFGFGLNGRYSKRNLPDGSFFPSGSVSDYGIKMINGEKQSVGLDAAFHWMGFSGQFEIIQSKMTPQDTASSLFNLNSFEKTQGKVFAGGFVTQLNYFIKSYKTILSTRYENFNANDLFLGINERFSFAIAYQIDGFNSMIKAQYIHIALKENINAADWVNQYRIGWQYQF